MAKDAAFTIRLRQRLKDAAQALTALDLIYRREGERWREVKLPSVNEAINVLITEGLRSALVMIQEELKPLEDHFYAYRQMMEFLIQHPDARRVKASDLPKGSAARDWLAANDKGESRIDVANKYARFQERLDEAIKAKALIEQALEPETADEKVEPQTPITVWEFYPFA